MFKTKFAEKTKTKKILTVVCAGVLIFLSVAVVLGVLNALVADGEWEFGWSSYRYDETGYTVGSSTVPSDRITSIDIDWLDGEVEIVLCRDAYASITETYEGELSENAFLRWKLSDDGTTFSVKYRKSAAFLGFGGGGEDKKLTVRIPENMVGQLASLTVNSEQANVTLDGVSANALSLSASSGTLTVSGGTYQTVTASTVSGNMKIDTTALENISLASKKGNIVFSNATSAKNVTLTSERGNVELSLPEPTGFALALNCEIDKFVSDRTLQGSGSTYTYGDASAKITLSSEKGAVRLYTRKES